MIKNKILQIIAISILSFFGGLFFINLFNQEISELLFSSKLNTFVSVSMFFFYIFFILRLRDYLLNTKFPIELINSNPISSSIYYSSSIIAFSIAIAIIVS